MKLVIIAGAIISAFSSLVHSVSYNILKLDNCKSSDETVLAIDSCVVTPSRVNISIDFKRPLTKFHVIFLINFFLALKLF